MKICSNCQTKNNEESIFCKRCGKRLKKETDLTKVVLLVGVFLVLFASIFFGILNWSNMNNLFRLIFFCFETCLFYLLSLALKKVSRVTSRIFFVIGLVLTPFTLSMVPYYNMIPSILYNDALIFLYLAIIYLLTFIGYKLINLKFKGKILNYLSLFSLLIAIIFAVLIFNGSSVIMGLVLTIYMLVLTIISKINMFSSNKSYYISSVILSFLLTPFLTILFAEKNDLVSMIINAVSLTAFLSDGYIKMFKEKSVMHFFTPFMFQLLSFVFICTIFNFNDTGVILTLILVNIAFYYVSLIFKNQLFSITTLVLTYIMLAFVIVVTLFDSEGMWLVITSALFLLFNISLLIVKKYNFAHLFMALNVLTLVVGLNTWFYNFDALVIIGFLLILYLIIYLLLNIIKNKYDFMYLIIMLLIGFVAFIIQSETGFSVVKLIICLVFVIGYVLINLLNEHISIRIIWFIILNFLLLTLFGNIYYSLLTISILTIIIGIVLQKVTDYNFKPHLLYAEIVVFIITLFNSMEYYRYALFINVLAYILGYVSLINFHNKKGWKMVYIMVGLLYITKLFNNIIDPIVISSLLSILINLIIITAMYLLDRFTSKELVVISLVTLIPFYALLEGLNVDLYQLYLIPFIVYHIILLFVIKWKDNVSRNVYILVPFFIFAIILLLSSSEAISTIINAIFAVTYIIIGLIKRFNLLIYFSIGVLVLAILLQLFTVLNSMAAIISLLAIGFILIFVAIIYSTKRKD